MFILNRDDILKMEEENFLKIEKKDPFYNVIKYTEHTVYSKHWNHITMNCRGLVTNKDYTEIVARPFKKFFNHNEELSNFSLEEYLSKKELGHNEKIYSKMDGSLGIVFWGNEGLFKKWRVATQGSLSSDQALWAEQWIEDHLELFNDFDKDYTFLFEIIYKDNRIVIDYENFEGLVLLGAIHTETGAEVTDLGLIDYPLKPNTYSIEELNEIVAKTTEKQDLEGFVLTTWTNPMDVHRVKIKLDYYLKIHKLKYSLDLETLHSIWYEGGEGWTNFIGEIPDEFHGVIKEWQTKFILNRIELQDQMNKYVWLLENFFNIPDVDGKKEKIFKLLNGNRNICKYLLSDDDLSNPDKKGKVITFLCDNLDLSPMMRPFIFHKLLNANLKTDYLKKLFFSKFENERIF
jgi:RNA ligase